jgi:hypothetical protein
MRREAPHVLEAVRLPALYREVCRYAGIPLTPTRASSERFVLRSGAEPPELYGRLLEEAFVEDGAEVAACRPDDPPDFRLPGPGRVVVQPGFGSPCPAREELHRAVQREGGRVLLFAVERRDAGGRLLGVTWAAVPEEEPPPEAAFRAAVFRYEYPAGPG